jgi:ADP-heptose:LPS heptosyltransferase
LVNLWRLSRRLRTEKYDLALDIKGDPAVIILLKLAGIRYRLGFSNGGLGFLLTHPFSQPQHLVRPRVDLALLAPLAGDFLIYERAPHLALTLDSNFLRTQANYRSGRPVISVHLGAGAPAKLWPLKYWLELLSSLAADYNIVVIGREGELNDLADLPEQLQAAFIKLIGRPWAETAQALANSALFIGADSGPGHLAAAVGCRVISIFSAANDPAEWAPAGARVLVFFPACAGCEKSVCSDLQCLRQITPAQVLAAAHEILLNYSGQNN